MYIPKIAVITLQSLSALSLICQKLSNSVHLPREQDISLEIMFLVVQITVSKAINGH